MTRRLTALATVLALLAPAAHADEVTDAMEAARAAYEAGAIQEALEELAYARQLLTEMKTASLTGFLPPAPAGWTREVDTEMAAGMAMMGGGVGAEATYSGPGEQFTLTMMADNPMVAGMASALSSAGLLGVAKRMRVGGERFLVQDGDLMALIGNRVLVQASGADPERMVAILEQIDFDALAAFGK